MRKFLLILLLFVYKNTFCQLNDNFEDGDFSHNPSWSGSDPNDFLIDDGRLRSNSGTASSNFYISTPNSKASNCSWEFDVNLKFSTSGANYVDVYLISDNSNLKSNDIKGYFVRIGNTTDEISLYKRNGSLNSAIKIIDGADGVVSSSSNNLFRIRITREKDGTFELERGATTSGTTYVSEGKVLDDTFNSSAYFGVYIQQSTVSFHQKHFFDNFLIKDIVTDQTPPALTDFKVAAKAINLIFDEALKPSSAGQADNYLVQPLNLVPASVLVNGNTVDLYFDEEFPTGAFTLSVSNLEDNNGNSLASPIAVDFTYKRPYQVKYKDIVINEIFADHSPKVELPSLEFVELWNRTEEDIPLKGFKYKDAGTTFSFVEDTIKAGSYLILCARSDTTDFSIYGKTIGLSPWPSLNNSGDHLTLFEPAGQIIDEVSYSDNWYGDDSKKSGGYTLELIDPENHCHASQNYKASKDPAGGTPGKPNSVYLENKALGELQVLNVLLKDSVTVEVIFSHAVDSLQASLPEHYVINNGVGSPQTVTISKGGFQSAELHYLQPLTRNLTYTAVISGVSDCGNHILATQRMEFIVPGSPGKGDVAISEVLFNPRPNGVDFVEIYNRSDKIIDLKDLYVASLDADKDSVTAQKALTGTQAFFLPGEYWVITTDPENIKKEYFVQNPGRFIKTSSMPAFNDDKGIVLILNKEGLRLDQLNYTESMHFPLLEDVEGISLERAYMDQESNKKGNFRSATASVGYASPTYKNSQEEVLPDVPNEGLSLSSPTFSPDNDGFEDVLAIQYKTFENNMVANVTIYDDLGRKIRNLVKNEVVSSEGNWIWDGLNEDNSKIKPGIYIVYAELFNLNAEVKKFKKTVVLASKPF